eukprot:6180704-Pleurochrysis_carterae.AAC.4
MCPPDTSFLHPPFPSRFRYPQAQNYFDLVTNVVNGPSPTERTEYNISSELRDLVHATLIKDPWQRPDVLAIGRHPFTMQGGMQMPALRAYLASVLQPGSQPASAKI